MNHLKLVGARLAGSPRWRFTVSVGIACPARFAFKHGPKLLTRAVDLLGELAYCSI